SPEPVPGPRRSPPQVLPPGRADDLTALVDHLAAQERALHATTQLLTLERRVALIRLGLGGAHHERLVGVEQHQVGVEALGDIAFAVQAEAERRRAAGEFRHAVGREATLRAL